MTVRIGTVFLILITITISTVIVSAQKSEKVNECLSVNCTTNGYFPSPNGDITLYIKCLRVNGRMYYWVFQCPYGTGYDPVSTKCTVDYNKPNGIKPVPSIKRQCPVTTCTRAGYQAHPSYGNQYYMKCFQVKGKWYYFVFKCPTGSLYDEILTVCRKTGMSFSLARAGPTDENGPFTSTKDCNTLTGNKGKCRMKGCSYNCETDVCELEKSDCDEKCSNHCSDVLTCEDKNCLYRSDTKCIDCSIYSSNPDQCRAAGCSFCCDTQLCQPHDTSPCEGACSNDCSNPHECTNPKCVVNPHSKTCEDCSAYNGQAEGCNHAGCSFDCKSLTCHASLADSGSCSSLCYDQGSCENLGCLYNPLTGECTVPPPTPPPPKCKGYRGDIDNCLANGCHFDCSGLKCQEEPVVPSNKCEQNCYDEEACKSGWCNFDETTGQCSPKTGSSPPGGPGDPGDGGEGPGDGGGGGYCEKYSGSGIACRDNGCSYCCDDKSCKKRHDHCDVVDFCKENCFCTN